MIKEFKSFLNKDNSDYFRGPVNPYEFHKYFYILSKAFLVLDNEPIPRKNYHFCNLLILNNTISMLIAILALFNGIRTMDLNQMVQGFSYLIVFIYALIILFTPRVNLQRYHNFFTMWRRDFHFICTSEGEKYRKRFFETQLVTWKLCVFTACFILMAIFVVICAIIMLFVYLATDHDPAKDQGRPLLFPVWFFDKDISATPYYEFFFIYTNISMIFIGYIYCYMVQTQLLWIRHITAKADLMIYAIQDLMEGIHPTNDPRQRAIYDEILKKRFRVIIKQHHSMFQLLHDFAGVYKKMLLYEQKMGGPVICFASFAAVEVWANNGGLNPVLLILCLATLFVCVVPSYMCTLLSEKIRSICDSCWDAPFWNASPVVRPYMVLVMQRSLRPLPLRAPGFEEVSLQTFSSNMAAAYSMFNMLRQTNIGSSLNN